MSDLRQPRVSVIVEGAPIDVLEVEITESKDQKADTCSVETALSALPVGRGPDWWSTSTDSAIQVLINGTKKFDGTVDEISIDFAGRTLHFSAKDKAAKLIHKKTTKKHINQKVHQVVQDLASDAGVPVDADSVPEDAGKLHQIDFTSITHRDSNWSKIANLAENFGMAAYMTQGKLFFKDPDEKLPPFTVNYVPPTPASYATGNVISLKCDRNCLLGRTVKSHVHSWSHKDKKHYDATETEAGSGGTLEYHHHYHNLNQDQVRKRAKHHKKGATKNELQVSVDLPGDPAMSARRSLQLTGTGTAFDQDYEVQSVEHRVSVSEGYRMTISAHSKSKKRGK